MSDGWRRSSLQQRLEKKVRYQYLRYLVNHRPETWCFRAKVRNRLRAIRRSRRRISRIVFPPRLRAMWDHILIAMLAAGILVLLWTFVGHVGEVASLPIDLFLTMPQKGTVMVAEDEARIAFTRVAVLQSLAILAAIVFAMTRLGPTSDFHIRAWFRRSAVLRNRIQLVRLLSIIPFGLAIVGGIAGARLLPHSWPCILASVAIGVGLMAAVYWGGRWLLRFPCLRADTIAGVLHFLVMILPLLSLNILWGESIVAIAHYLPWLGPLGWLWAGVAEIGEGKFPSAAIPATTLMFLTAAVARVRHRVKSWSYRRKLIDAVASQDQEEAVSRSMASPPPAVGLAEALLGEIRRIPRRGKDWFTPWWLKNYLRWFLVATGIGMAVQGFAVYVQHLQTILQATSVGGDAELSRVVFGLSLAPIALITASIESIALVRLEGSRLERLARFPLSPWLLWERLQRFGMLRAPVEIAWTLPMLVIPAAFIENGLAMSLLTLGMTLATLVALRTLAVSGAAMGATTVVWRPWMFVVLWMPAMVGVGFLAPAVIATLPIEASPLLTLTRQAALQVGSIFIMAAMSILWYFLLGLPHQRVGKIPETQSSDGRKW